MTAGLKHNIAAMKATKQTPHFVQVLVTFEEALAEIEQLRALLGKLEWKSIDKDNMEFRCVTTCYVMDEIRRVLQQEKA